MALNLGAMIQAARSQRNPAGEFIVNAQTQQLMNKSNGSSGGSSKTASAQPQQPVQGSGFGDIIQRALENLFRRG